MLRASLILNALLLVLVLFLGQCVRSHKRTAALGANTTTVLEQITKHDTVTNTLVVTQYLPKEHIIYVDQPTIQFEEVDTAAILKDYYAYKISSQHINDSNIAIVVQDTISQNSIVGRSLTYNFVRKIENNTSQSTTIEPKEDLKSSTRFDIGIQTTINLDKNSQQEPTAAVVGSFSVPKGTFQAGYNTQKQVIAGILIKIK